MSSNEDEIIEVFPDGDIYEVERILAEKLTKMGH